MSTEEEVRPPPEVAVVEAGGVGQEPAARMRRRSPSRLLRLAVVGVVVLAVLYGFFGAFATHLWFEQRQRALALQGPSFLAAKVGEAVGTLQVSEPFTLNVQIVQGDDPDQLRAGPGHAVGTPLPGLIGNSVVYGHEDLWGAPFKQLHLALPGTELYLKSLRGTILTYKVVTVRRVSSARLAAYVGPSTDYRLTLITDGAGRFSNQRLVVVAVSGTVGTLHPAPPGSPVGPTQPSLLDTTLAQLVGWLAVTAAVVVLLRRRHSRTATFLAAVPPFLLAFVAAYLWVGLLWSPLA